MYKINFSTLKMQYVLLCFVVGHIFINANKNHTSTVGFVQYPLLFEI